MRTLLGIDLGTQSLKVLLYDPDDHQTLVISSAPLSLISAENGTREQHASDWICALAEALAKVPSNLRRTIIAIGVSGQQHGFVPLDKEGNVIAPVKLWCDTTATSERDEIVSAVGPEFALKTVGHITAGFVAPKIRWMKKRNPKAYEELATVLLPRDYINFHLTGRRCTEVGDASGTAVLDVEKLNWNDKMLNGVDSTNDLRACMPEILNAGGIVGTILPEIAEKYNLPRETLVSTGGGDNMMAAIGTGNVKSGCLTASLGTSGTLFAYSEKAVIDKSAALAAFCSSTGGWLPLLCTMNCTVATEQLRRLCSVDVADVDNLVSNIAPGSDGVTTLPFYNGERFPDLPNGKAVIYGLDMQNTTPAHLMRSAMECGVFGLKHGLEVLRANGLHFDEVTLTGGGSGSQEWAQMVADIFDLDTRILKQKENAAFGAALHSLWAYYKHHGEEKSISEVTQEHLEIDKGKCCKPDEERVKIYDEVYQRYLHLLDSLTPVLQGQ